MEKKQNRIEEIDALRGVAALSVVLFHYTTMYDHLRNARSMLGWHFTIGFYGIYLFFVISGFVIVLTLHRCRTGLDFIVSRFSRIFPAYWMALTLSFIIMRLLHSQSDTGLVQLGINYTMLQRIFGYAHIDSVYWTLNVEMSFYFWMLIVFKLGWLDKIQFVIPFVLAFQFFMAIYSRSTDHVFSQGVRVAFLLEYAHLFCAGMLFYEAREHGFSPWRLLLLIWCLLNQLMVPFRDFEWRLPDIFGEWAVLCVFIAMFLVVRGHLRWLVNPVFISLGAISYTLYLLHNEIGKAIRDDMESHGFTHWQGFGAAIFFSFSLATMLTVLIERPAMGVIRQRYRQWKKRDDFKK